MKKAATLKDIATKLNMSVTTISKALNNHPDISEKRKLEICNLAKEMHYIPNAMASNLRKQRTKFVGLIVGDNTNPYFARMIKGVEERLTTEGYHTLIFNSNEKPEKEIELLMELRSLNVAGVILTPAAGNKESSRLLKRFEIPYVLANRYIDKHTDNYVIVNDEKASYIATDYLLKYNNDKIFFLNFMEGVSTAVDRRLGYESALMKRGITPDPDWIIHDCINQDDGYIAMKDILSKHKLPFSVLCYSDYIAIGAIKALNENGVKMPDEVAIMGIDDIDIVSFVRPGLTTVHIPKSELGQKSAEMLLNIINDDEDAVSERQIILQPSLVIRETA